MRTLRNLACVERNIVRAAPVKPVKPVRFVSFSLRTVAKISRMARNHWNSIESKNDLQSSCVTGLSILRFTSNAQMKVARISTVY